MHLKCNLLTHIELQRLLLLFYMQFIAKQVTITRYPLKGEGYEVLFLPNPLGHVVEEHRSKKARLETRAAISCKRAFVSRPPPTAHSIPVKEECFLWFYASYDSIVLLHLDHVQHVPEE